jgi:hypothetical protein
MKMSISGLWLVPGAEHHVFTRLVEYLTPLFQNFSVLDYRAAYQMNGPGRCESEIEREVERQSPAVVLYTQFPNSFCYLSPQLLRRLASRRTVVGLGFDDEMYFDQAKAHYQVCSALLTTDLAGAEFFRQIGRPVLTVSMLTVSMLTPIHTTALAGADDVDISFVGDMTKPGRREYVWALEQAGIEVRDHGLGSRHGWLRDEEAQDLTRRSKICLNFTAVNPPTWIARHDPLRARLGQIKARPFDLAAMRKFCLCEWSPCVAHWFEPEKEIAVFRDADDLVQQVRRYLAAPELRMALAEAAHQRYLRDYAPDVQWPRIFKTLLEAPRTPPAPLLLDGPLFHESMGRSRGVAVLHALRCGALLRAAREPFSRWSMSLDYWRGVVGGILDTIRARYGQYVRSSER